MANEEIKRLAVRAESEHKAALDLLAEAIDALNVELAKPDALVKPSAGHDIWSVVIPPLGVGRELAREYAIKDFSPKVQERIADVRMIQQMIEAARRDFTTDSLRVLGLASPAALLPLNEDHALVLAVRDDLADTERRIDLALSNANLTRRVIPAVSKTQYLIPDIPPPPSSWGWLILAGLVLYVVASRE